MNSRPEQLTVRAATAEDLPLLRHLFLPVCREEFAALGLSESNLTPLLEMQFQARQRSYLSGSHAADSIVCTAEGTALGRILLDRQPDCMRIVDIAVLPEFRNRRIGTWAVHTAQIEAARAGLPLRLSVRKSNPALRLYQRQGFTVAAEDALAFEMAWRMLPGAEGLPGKVLLHRIVTFLREIGLRVESTPLSANTFLPGITLMRNGLQVDPDRLLYPGDLLHEAGHLAVMPASLRDSDFPEPVEIAEEIAATAWSHAAALHLGIPVEQVIHDKGYRGSAQNLRDALATPSGPGVPLLHWMGLVQPHQYPCMTRWLRQDATEDLCPEHAGLELAAA